MSWKGYMPQDEIRQEDLNFCPIGQPINFGWRRISFLVVLLTLCFSLSTATFAQSGATQARSISIGVAVGLSVYANRALNFGTVVAGTVAHSVAVTDAAAGKVTISGQWNRTVYVTLTPQASLVSGSNTLPYTPGAAYNSSADNPSAAAVWASPTGRQAGFRLRANRSGQTGEAFIYIYGSINVGIVPPGNYSGLYLLSVSYN
jgi:hypothetical protein